MTSSSCKGGASLLLNSKAGTITELVARTEADTTEALTSSLEASVRQYGQEWDFEKISGRSKLKSGTGYWKENQLIGR